MPSARGASAHAPVGQLWSVDASDLDAEKLSGERGLSCLGGLFDDLIKTLDLHPIGPPTWHVFPGPNAGVTGIVALSESHLACHSFPEHAGLTIDLYTCRHRPTPDWERFIKNRVGRSDVMPRVDVRAIARGFRSTTGSPASTAETTAELASESLSGRTTGSTLRTASGSLSKNNGAR